MWPQSCLAGGFADGQDDLDDAGDGHRAALAEAEPQGSGMVAAFVEPGGDTFPGDLEQGDGPDLVAFAVQADGAGASGDGDVFDIEAGAFLFPRAIVEQHGGDGCVAGAAAYGGSLDRALFVLLSERKNTDGSVARVGDETLRAALARAATAHLLEWADVLTPHVMRHFCAPQLYQQGMDLIAIQQLLGHAWIATTMKYVHVTGTHIEDAWAAGQQRAATRLEELRR